MHSKRPYIGHREIYRFDQHWNYKKIDVSHELAMQDGQGWEEITLPHSNVLLPHSDFPVERYQFHSLYKKSFTLDNSKAGQRIKLHFDGAMTVAEVYVNQQKVGMHRGGYTSFSFDITENVRIGEVNEVMVHLDSTPQKDIPPEGNEVDYLLFGGIYRSAFLEFLSPLYLEDIYLYTEWLTDKLATIKGQVILRNEGEISRSAEVSLQFVAKNGDVQQFILPEQMVSAKDTATVEVHLEIENPKWWSLSTPYLYQVKATLQSIDAHRAEDDVEFAFGIRTISVQSGYLEVNGEPVKLVGLNRHQMFPYVGNAAPWRLQRKDAEILKYELGVNYVRTSHYPQDPSFLDACDELGLLVFTELPGWQHIGDGAWQRVALQHLEELIRRDRNHASIFMWGVRINESPDDHDFYQASNTLAKALDPHRLTGGVRNFRASEWLEDVFTYNDFSMGVLPTANAPQLVTEFAGHMYPAKPNDEEHRLLKHALYHASIINEVHGREDIIGASGWCAFDYNTHSNFGSGSNVCFHGVMDMFRVPKFAGLFYKSRRSPDEEVVLEFATYAVHGSPEHTEIIVQDEGNKEFYPRNYAAPLYLFSNCDEVELIVNGATLGKRQPLRDEFPHLSHPPFRFEQRPYKFVGDYLAIGYLHGEKVIEKTLQTPQGLSQLKLVADYDSLIADGADMTRLTVYGLDHNGTVTPYATRAIQFELTGPGVLVGENPVALEGGRIAVFVKATRVPGTILVTAHASGTEGGSVRIETHPSVEPAM